MSSLVNPLIEASNWFLAFYSTIPVPVHWLCGLAIVNFMTYSLIHMLMRM